MLDFLALVAREEWEISKADQPDKTDDGDGEPSDYDDNTGLPIAPEILGVSVF